MTERDLLVHKGWTTERPLLIMRKGIDLFLTNKRSTRKEVLLLFFFLLLNRRRVALILNIWNKIIHILVNKTKFILDSSLREGERQGIFFYKFSIELSKTLHC